MSRSRELTEELARRYEERAEQEAIEAARIAKAAADAQAKADAERAAFNEQLRQGSATSRARQAEMSERLFPAIPESEPSDRPEGSADGGVGEAETATYEDTPDGQRMRVFSDEELYGNPDEKGT